jgi:hypothetical protein
LEGPFICAKSISLAGLKLALLGLHQGNGTCFFEFLWDLKKCEKTDKSKKGLKATKLTATFLCWVDCLKKALLKLFKV